MFFIEMKDCKHHPTEKKTPLKPLDSTWDKIPSAMFAITSLKVISVHRIPTDDHSETDRVYLHI